jgi:hypothetical protein
MLREDKTFYQTLVRAKSHSQALREYKDNVLIKRFTDLIIRESRQHMAVAKKSPSTMHWRLACLSAPFRWF